ncbi:hypothetical protein GSI_06703 [Ganoderma sinense ZZ0214-1]|uniref:MYND-type domain-containing protein n=1 Tax=Ganoderma sinense ZZ0214-1 TaxID=1077348 RepID=A0A2G8SE21_9APHY|nr:hypothetical protein GSI_06703 [Ganoderma sinense ZZ0214-1]
MDATLTFSADSPSPSSSPLDAEVSNLTLQARQLDARGCYYDAERLLHKAMGLVDLNVPSSSLANLLSGLGELYFHMGNLDGAEEWFQKSLDVGVLVHNFKGIAAGRENLARVRRVRGEVLKAKALKVLGAPDDMCCGSYSCANGLLRTSDLRICGGCKGAFYCSHNCQREDWERHKRRCRHGL